MGCQISPSRIPTCTNKILQLLRGRGGVCFLSVSEGVKCQKQVFGDILETKPADKKIRIKRVTVHQLNSLRETQLAGQREVFSSQSQTLKS